MKEYRKWWIEASANYISDIEVKRDGRLIEVGWRAALELVLDKFPIEGYHGNPIRQYIEDELYEN